MVSDTFSILGNSLFLTCHCYKTLIPNIFVYLSHIKQVNTCYIITPKHISVNTSYKQNASSQRSFKYIEYNYPLLCQISQACPKGVVTNYGEGGATKREGGAREVLPLRKGGAEKVLAILKGGHKKFWGRFYTVA